MSAINSTNWASICELPANERPQQTWITNFYVWRPGAKEADERLGSDWLVLLNELGQEGWKLVESVTTHSRIYDYLTDSGSFYGHKAEIAAPIQTRYIFMREVGT